MSAQPYSRSSLEDAVERCLDVLDECAVDDGSRVGWGTWDLDDNGNPTHLSAARVGLYDGNAGIAWAMRVLGRGRSVPAAGGDGDGPGMLSGAAGTALSDGRSPAPAMTGRGTDLGDGYAGDLLACVRTGAGPADVAALVDALARSARWDGTGACWPDPRPGGEQPLCGMAHGTSGVVLALAEAAAAVPDVAPEAIRLIDAGLRWESAWFDPVAGGWPDLRGDGRPGHPVLWCHGAAGIAAVRLRLLDLGLPLGYATDALAAEAHAGVLACGRDLSRAVTRARDCGLGDVHGGLTLCHGLGGALDVLVLASEVWDAPSHLEAARRIATDLVALAPDDPLEWPSGLAAEGCLGLFVGVAGTALILARVADPSRVGSLSLLALER